MDGSVRFLSDVAVAETGRSRQGGVESVAFEATLSERWWVLKGPNGGYVAAILANASQMAIGDLGRRPRSVTVHYLSRPRAGDCAVTVGIARRGRTATFTSVRLVQDGDVKALGLIVLAAERPGLVEFQDVTMPPVPAPEDCPTLGEATGFETSPVPITGRYDIRLALGPPPFSADAEEALTGAWMRFAEPHVPDALFAIAASDGMPPAVLTKRTEGPTVLGVPTVDLTVHLHEPLPLPDARPGDWCLAVFRTKKSSAGLLDEDGEIWSRDGLLLAQSRQHAVPL